MTTSRFPNGITTAKKTDPMGQFILPDFTKAHVYWEDFDYFTAADWTITTVEAGAGAATEALGNEDGGTLVITNDNADNDSDFFNKVGESFTFETGKKVWFEAKFKANNATDTDIVMGLQITDTTPLDVTDGVFFIKPDNNNEINFVVEKDNTATTTSNFNTVGLVNGVFIRLGFFYDGVDSIALFSDGVQVGSSVTTNLPDDEELTISFGIQNGEAAGQVLTVDYILVAKER